MRWLMQKWRAYKTRKLAWATHEPWFQAVLYRVPPLQRLADGEKSKLRQMVKEFMVSKSFFGAGGLELDLGTKIKIATLACWPALHLGFSALDGFSSVVVYEDSFRATRQAVDQQTGLVSEYQQTMLGETSQHGPVVLSKADIDRDLAGIERFGNVVVHEIAHKIDALDGAIDGVPPLHPHMSKRHFSGSLGSAFDALKQDLSRGHAPIDRYAAHSPPEFFAVTSEYYFLAPAHLNAMYPGVFAQLDAFYRKAS